MKKEKIEKLIEQYLGEAEDICPTCGKKLEKDKDGKPGVCPYGHDGTGKKDGKGKKFGAEK